MKKVRRVKPNKYVHYGQNLSTPFASTVTSSTHSSCTISYSHNISIQIHHHLHSHQSRMNTSNLCLSYLVSLCCSVNFSLLFNWFCCVVGSVDPVAAAGVAEQLLSLAVFLFLCRWLAFDSFPFTKTFLTLFLCISSSLSFLFFFLSSIHFFLVFFWSLSFQDS